MIIKEDSVNDVLTQGVINNLKTMFSHTGINTGKNFASILSGNTTDVLDRDNISNLYGKQSYVYPRSRFKEEIIFFIRGGETYFLRVGKKTNKLEILLPQMETSKNNKVMKNISLQVPVPDCVMKGHFSYSQEKKVIVFFITDVLNIEGNSLLNLSFEQRRNSLNQNGQLMN